MQQATLNSESLVMKRTKKIRNAFQKASPEMKSKVYELVPFTKKTEDGSNIIDFCDWQQWSQWSQRQ